MRYHALSLKQPWAALLAAGLKTIEIRRWRTDFRGPLLIHAARKPDDRPETWTLVPPELHETAQLEGGIIGVGTLTACKVYRSAQTFTSDRHLHLNDPSWFDSPGLFGFCFADLRPLPFRRVRGYVRIFEVEIDDLDLPVPTARGGLVEGVMQRIRRLVQSLAKSSNR